MTRPVQQAAHPVLAMSEARFYLTLLRHGESLGNQEARLQGQRDYPLTEKGRRQARERAVAWRSQGVTFDRIVSSPLQRARCTAETVGEALGLPVALDPVWQEHCFGELEGLTLPEIRQRMPLADLFHPHRRPPGPGAESLFEVYERAGRAVQGLLSNPEGHCLVVSHGDFLNMVLYTVLGLTPLAYPHNPRFHFGNTGFAKFVYDPEARFWRMLALEDHV
ncbi:MAG TPA: histidine phosphatase family protein [Anaerolineales bacterium]